MALAFEEEVTETRRFNFWEVMEESGPEKFFHTDEDGYTQLQEIHAEYLGLVSDRNKMIELVPAKADSYREQFKKALEFIEPRIQELLGERVRFV